MPVKDRRAINKRYYLKNREWILADKRNEFRDPTKNSLYRKVYTAKHPDRYMLQSAKKRAKRDNLPFDLTAKDIVIPSHCPVLGIELKRTSIIPGDSSPSLDRIRPERGYVRGNVIVVSNRANRIKNNSNPDELIRVAEYYRGLLADAN